MKADDIEYIQEHLEYELLMLRYAFKKIKNNQNISQLDWNANFIAHTAVARNLYAFLVKKDDTRNFDAKDFIKGFRAEKTEKIFQTLNRLREQVLHLGTNRKQTGEGKAGLEDSVRVNEWIEREMARFVVIMEQQNPGVWLPDRADPCKGPKDASSGYTGPAGPSASSHVVGVTVVPVR